MHLSALSLALLLLGASVLAVVICRRVNLPPVLGYLLVGSIIGPHALNLMDDVHRVEYLAEFGVVFLMFSIGLEFSLPKLYAMKRIVFGLGLLQVVVSMLLIAGLVMLAGFMLFVFIREPKEYESTGEERPELLANLRLILRDPDRSALRLFLAHFFWFIALNAVEAFFTLYAKNHLGYPGEHGSRILGQFLLTLVLFALPAGAIGGKIGRRRSIMLGLSLLMATLLTIYFLDRETLTTVITRLPVLGTVPVVGGLLMVCGCSWMLVNVNSLPMVVDLTDDLHAGTYTGIYYLFITAAAIAGPNINGWIIQLTGNDYSSIYIASPLFIALAFVMMAGVRRGEARSPRAVDEDRTAR